MLAGQTGDEPRFEVLIRVVEELNSESGELYVLFQSISRGRVNGVMRRREESFSDAAEYSTTTPY